MARFGKWKYSLDRGATIRAYELAGRGGVDTCDCAYCRNFRVARDQVFPPQFLALLAELGIDPRKDGEVYHNARLSPGRHDYMGWYHFVGTLDETGDFPLVSLGEAFAVWLCRASAPRLTPLKDLPAVQLEFHAEAVPWLLAEPEPERVR